MEIPVNWQQFVDLSFYAICTGGLAYMVKFLSKISDSINELNKQMAVIIERTGSHENRIQKLEVGG